MEDNYKTVASNIRIERKIKKCKFITSIKNVKTTEEAEKFINQIADEFSDATHNVFAFKVGLADQAITRCSDDGEPAGSSGPPALQALEGKGITNVAVVVTRYFGGVKHGVGGLIRAYGDSVREAVKEAGIEERVRYFKFSVAISYELLGEVINYLEGSLGQVKNVEYKADGVEVIGLIKPSFFTGLTAKIKEATKGEAEVEVKGDEFKR
ncbi:YigZ family protein [Natroniella sulfidigena]|uniref:YigZ family protein n=1 Tax=Natroniella sulfidigena TaxID=723921 RepID=UPI00200A3996|nr:YigZ family protein [Natroniella sulfidigena]MCK8815985.1 YigZ family protein [Natroniella sulfidigena]